jgi:hypothetical protein
LAHTIVDVVADAVRIRIRRAVTATHAKGVELVSVAVAVAFRDVSTSALVNLTWTVADSAHVVCADTVVDVITEAVFIGVRRTFTAAHAYRIKLVPFAIAIASRDVFTSAFVDLSRAVAHAARVVRTHAVVHVVTDAVRVFVRRAVASADSKRVELVSIAVAVARRDVSTSALVDLARSVADAARVVSADTIVDVVADAVRIRIRRAVTATHAKGVELVSVAVAVAFRDVSTSALVNLTWSVANAARVVAAYAVVDVITDAVRIDVRRTRPSAFSKRVELVAIAVAIACGDAAASAHPTLVQFLAGPVFLCGC